MTSLELAGYLKGGNVSAVEVADAIDAYLDARLEQAMPKIIAAVRADVNRKWDGRPCTSCGHVCGVHSATGCGNIGCNCKAFRAIESRELSAT